MVNKKLSVKLGADQDVLEVKNEIIKRMSNFVVDPSFRKGKLKYSYPWHLASVFHVASLE